MSWPPLQIVFNKFSPDAFTCQSLQYDIDHSLHSWREERTLIVLDKCGLEYLVIENFLHMDPYKM
jgi:hypothetical protein